MARKTGTYYWKVKGHLYSRNFRNISSAKKYLLLRIKKDRDILGRNILYYCKSIIQDIEVGSYGINGKWRKH